MNETSVHVVITDVRKDDRPHASSVVNLPSGAGLARFRAALSECCRFVKQATRSPVCGEEWLPRPDRMGEGQARDASSWAACWNHRSRDSGTESSSSGVNWGPSVGQRAVGIRHKPTVVGRSSDVAILSDEAGGQNNRWRSQGPLDESARISIRHARMGRKS